MSEATSVKSASWGRAWLAATLASALLGSLLFAISSALVQGVEPIEEAVLVLPFALVVAVVSVGVALLAIRGLESFGPLPLLYWLAIGAIAAVPAAAIAAMAWQIFNCFWKCTQSGIVQLAPGLIVAACGAAGSAIAWRIRR